MRLIILSCNTGEGHNSAAKAIKERFEESGHECVIKDALAYWSPEKSKLISKGHVFIYRRLPKLFGISYNFEENHPPKDGDQSLMYDLVIRGCDSLYEDLSSGGYDEIICTHVFPSMMITELKKRKNLDIPAYFVATDYTCSPGVSQTNMDGYFIPNEKLVSEFSLCGLDEKRLIPTGIPVSSKFYSTVEKEKAKHTLGLPAGKRVVLLMCGSMGCGPIKSLTEYLPMQMPEDSVLVVICGNNRKLHAALLKQEQPENVRIIGYTTRVSLYMDAAEFILTKPGGLSSTEAATKGLPMIFIDAVPGCETRNIDFFLKYGFADMRESVIETCDLVCDFLENPELPQKMSSALKAEFSENAAEKIYNFVNEGSLVYYG